MIYITSLAITLAVIGVFIILLMKIDNKFYRLLGFTVPMFAIAFFVVFDARLIGEPRTLELQTITLYEEFDTVEIVSYFISDSEEIYLLIIDKNNSYPVYIKLAEVPRKQQDQFKKKAKEAEESGGKLMMKFKGDSFSFLEQKMKQFQKEQSGITPYYEFEVVAPTVETSSDPKKEEEAPMIHNPSRERLDTP